MVIEAKEVNTSHFNDWVGGTPAKLEDFFQKDPPPTYTTTYRIFPTGRLLQIILL